MSCTAHPRFFMAVSLLVLCSSEIPSVIRADTESLRSHNNLFHLLSTRVFAHKISVPLVPEIAFILRGVCLYVNIPIKMTAQCHSSIHATLLWMVSAQPCQRSCEQKIFFKSQSYRVLWKRGNQRNLNY